MYIIAIAVCWLFFVFRVTKPSLFPSIVLFFVCLFFFFSFLPIFHNIVFVIACVRLLSFRGAVTRIPVL